MRLKAFVIELRDHADHISLYIYSEVCQGPDKSYAGFQWFGPGWFLWPTQQANKSRETIPNLGSLLYDLQ